MLKIVPEKEFQTWLYSANFHDLNGLEADSHLYLVIRKWGHRFAVHRYNNNNHKVNCDYSAGYYFDTEEEALEKFCQIKKQIRYHKE